ncbi:MAG: hypothetical protein ACPL7J_15505, partial [Desulfomonilaceae bacterium]
TVVIATAVAMFLSMAGQWFPRAFNPFFELLYRSYLSWNFVGPFTPFGMIPYVLVLQTVSLLGLALALFAGIGFIRRRLPECQRSPLRAIYVTLAVGIALALGAAGGVIAGIRSKMAPFEASEFFAVIPPWLASINQPELSKPYIWTRDGALIFFPSKYAMVRQACSASISDWAKKVAEGKSLYRLECRPSSEYLLVLIYPVNSLYPAELQGLVSGLELLSRRAQIWRRTSQTIVAPPTSGIGFEDTPHGLFVSFESLMDWGKREPVAQRICAWSLTELSGLPDLERVYLAFYLLEGLDSKLVSKYLERLRQETSETIKDKNLFYHLHPLWKRDWGASEATRILEHWERGETIGHETYIRMLLQGAEK